MSLLMKGLLNGELFLGASYRWDEETPSNATGPLRLGVKNFEIEKERVIKELNVATFEIDSREEVLVRWGTFKDPWGNQIGFFE